MSNASFKIIFLALTVCFLSVSKESVCQQSQVKTAFKYLALGDSYTIGERVAEHERWPLILQDTINSLDLEHKITHVKIVATTGWTTQELSEALDKEAINTNYDLVSLLIGVNNQYRKYPVEDYPQEFTKLLERAIVYANGDKRKVFVVSIPDYGFTPFGEKNQKTISAELDEYNQINKSITEEMGVKYYHITDISRDGLKHPELVAEDKLHPSGMQYQLWVNRIIADKDFLKLFK